jgi:hypothetical protein
MDRMKLKLSQFLMVLLLCLAVVSKSTAQDTAAAKNKWQHLVQPYLMFPVMDGTVGLGQLPDADIHANASDIFSNLKFGAMLYFEAYNDHWAITSDIIYMNLSEDIQGGKRGIVRGEAGAKQFVWELAGLRRIKPWLDVGIGLRVINLKSSLDMTVDSTVVTGARQRSSSITETWVDPIIIGRVKFPAGKNWLFQLRADIGGFGIGSDFAWQAQADVGYRLSKLFQLGLGYRYIGIDYENGSGNDRFLYNVDTYGPAIKLGFNF